MRRLIASAMLLCLSVEASATPAGVFIERFEAAMASAGERARAAHGSDLNAVAKAASEDPQLRPFVKEMFDAVDLYKVRVDASKAAGKPRSCPPKTMTLTHADLFADIRRLPPAWQTRELADALAEALDRRYACPVDAAPAVPKIAPSDVYSTSMTGRVFGKAERAPVPIEVVNNAIIFQAMIDGKPATMLLDNGAEATVIDVAFARRLGLKIGPVRGYLNTGTTRLPLRPIESVAIEVPGGFALKGGTGALDTAPISKTFGRTIDGVLGGDILGNMAVMVRPYARQMTFASSGTFKPARPDDGAVLPIVDGNQIDVTVNGRTVRLQIDLGLTGAIQLTDAAWSRVFPAGYPTVLGPTFTTGDGVSHASWTARAAVRIGPISSENAPISSGHATTKTIDGLLGAGLLMKGAFVLDLKAGQLMFTPPRKPAVPQ